MKRKVERVAQTLVEKLIQWDTVDTITLAESAEAEIYDPYFFLSLDVYYREFIPESDERLEMFSDAGIFESSRINTPCLFQEDWSIMDSDDIWNSILTG